MSAGVLRHLGAAVAVMAAALLFGAASNAEPVAGRDYAVLSSPQKPDSSDKIEVIEFFSYGCPHCYHFHPQVSYWAKQLPANVTFIRVPVSLGRTQWGQLVRAYYTLQATGDLARLDTALFDAIHKDHQQLFDEASLTAWAAKNGVPAGKFHEAFNSFNVSTRASRAEQMARDYQVQGIPHMVVDGKYEILGADFPQVLRNASQVVELVQKKAHE